MLEQWKDIEGFEGMYQVSNTGKVRSFRRCAKGRELTPWYAKNGYCQVYFVVDNKRIAKKVHRLVAQAFIENPESKPEVNHVDGRKENNHVSNLEWSTRQENMNHARKTGLLDDNGENSKNAKLTNDQAEQIRKEFVPRHKEFGAVPLALKYGVGRKVIERIVKGQSYRV